MEVLADLGEKCLEATNGAESSEHGEAWEECNKNISEENFHICKFEQSASTRDFLLNADFC